MNELSGFRKPGLLGGVLAWVYEGRSRGVSRGRGDRDKQLIYITMFIMVMFIAILIIKVNRKNYKSD
jgi:hypothetical protein